MHREQVAMYEHLDEIGLQHVSELLGDRIYGARVRERERLPNTGCNHAAKTSHRRLISCSLGFLRGLMSCSLGLIRGSSLVRGLDRSLGSPARPHDASQAPSGDA